MKLIKILLVALVVSSILTEWNYTCKEFKFKGYIRNMIARKVYLIKKNQDLWYLTGRLAE
jgi:hypothetical protein